MPGKGIDKLKDLLWENLNAPDAAISEESNEEFVHRDREASMLSTDFADWDEEEERLNSDEDTDEEELEEYDLEMLEE